MPDEDKEETDWKGAASEAESGVRDMEDETDGFSERVDERKQQWESAKDDQQAPGAMHEEQRVAIDTDFAKQRQEEKDAEEEPDEDEEEDEGPREDRASGADSEEEGEADDDDDSSGSGDGDSGGSGDSGDEDEDSGEDDSG